MVRDGQLTDQSLPKCRNVVQEVIDECCEARRPTEVWMGQQVPIAGEFLNWRQHLHQRPLRIAEGGGQRRDANPGLHSGERTEHAVVAIDNACVWHRQTAISRRDGSS